MPSPEIITTRLIVCDAGAVARCDSPSPSPANMFVDPPQLRRSIALITSRRDAGVIVVGLTKVVALHGRADHPILRRYGAYAWVHPVAGA